MPEGVSTSVRMPQWAKTTGAIVFIVIAGVAVLMKQQKDEAPATQYEPTLKCRACGAEFRTSVDVSERPPFVCLHCGKRAAWNLWRCNDCGTKFLPEMKGDPPTPDMIPQCPKCKGKSVGRA